MLQDIDVETLMQEIKQWGPQDQAVAPAERSLEDEPDAQTPRRASSPKEDQAIPSPATSLTPDQPASVQEESPSSHAKVRQGFVAIARDLLPVSWAVGLQSLT